MLDAVYCGNVPIERIYFGRGIIFEGVTPFDFHVIEDGKLIILGAYSTESYQECLYIDCVPDWTYPVQNGNVLTVEQVYLATQNGNVLEVE